MVKNRIVYVLVLVVVVQFVYIYEHEMTYVALYAVATLPLVSLGVAVSLRHSFVIRERLSTHILTKGEGLHYSLYVANRSFLPCSGLLVSFWTDEIGLNTNIQDTLISIPPLQSYTLEFDIEPKYRGSYAVGVREIVIYDFLGLFRLRQRYESSQDFMVNPRIVEKPNIYPYMRAPRESANQYSFNEDHSMVSELRKYHPTDGFKKIHWKASAKKGELISKMFRNTESESLSIFVDNTRRGTAHEHILKLEDEMVESIVSVLLNLGEATATLHSMGAEPETGGFTHLFGVAASLQFGKYNGLDAYMKSYAAQAHEPSNIVVVAQQLSDALVAALEEVAGLGHTIAVLHFDKPSTQLSMRCARLDERGISCKQPVAS